jgi:hypothetical protein
LSDLADTPFAVLLGTVRALGASGVLSLHEQKNIYFLQGKPVGVRTNFPEEISEVYMLRHGIVAESDLARVRREATAFKLRFGEALLGLGYLERHELYEHTRRHAIQNLTTCFRWEQGPVEWTGREDFAREIVPVPLDLIDVFVTGVSRFYDRNRLDRELPLDDGAKVYAKPPPGTPTDRALLGTLDSRIVQLAAGRPSVASLAMLMGIADKIVRQRLYVLYCLGHIGFEQGAPKAFTRPQSKIPTVPAFRAAPTPRTRIATPSPAMPPEATPKRRPTLPLVPDLPLPRPLIPREDPSGVDQLLDEARRARAANQHHVAIATLRTALTRAPQNAVVLAELALSLVTCAPRLHAREANRLAREARRLDPKVATSYVVLGMLLQHVGEFDRAREMYQFALDRDPKCAEALALLCRR